MKYCPSCKYEYEDHITHCSDCGAELVSTEEAQAAPQEERSKDDHFNWQKLTTVESKSESKQLKEILKQFSIACKYEEAAKGGFEIMVPRVQYQTALGIVHQVFAATAKQSGVAEEMSMNEAEFEAQALAAADELDPDQEHEGDNFGAKIILALAIITAAGILLKLIS